MPDERCENCGETIPPGDEAYERHFDAHFADLTGVTIERQPAKLERAWIESEAWTAWENAWDRARNADRRAGRRYDKSRYSEAAHRARIRVLGHAEQAGD